MNGESSNRTANAHQAPMEEIVHSLEYAIGLGRELREGRFGRFDRNELEKLIAQAAQFAEDELAPLARGEDESARFENGRVIMPKGWRAAYESWCAAGWNGLCAPEKYGGRELPFALGAALFEIWSAASMAFAMGPALTASAIELLAAHASESLRDQWLEKLVSGKCMAALDMTETQAGSDLNDIRTEAYDAGDGSYRLFGEKVFVTYGEHDLCDNIVHFVLARLPGAPWGQRGLSLFLAPKFLPDENGENGAIGARNHVHCRETERKLGLRAAPVCAMSYGASRGGERQEGESREGAKGWLIGARHYGLPLAFTMLNRARVLVAAQAVGVAQAALGKTESYARTRKQGFAEHFDGEGYAPLIYHRDVHRAIMTMRALTHSARIIVYECAYARDRGADDRFALLAPLAKAFAADIGFEVAAIGLQLHGAIGYRDGEDISRLMRDARGASISQGANAIQAIDLVLRKVPRAEGRVIAAFLADLDGMVEAIDLFCKTGLDKNGLRGVPRSLREALAELAVACNFMLNMSASKRSDRALCGATPYLRLMGLVTGACYLARSARCSPPEKIGERMALARFMVTDVMSEAPVLRARVEKGYERLKDAGPALFGADIDWSG